MATQYYKYLELGASYGKNYKQTLKDCEKRLQKDPNNAGLLVSLMLDSCKSAVYVEVSRQHI